MVKKIKEYNAKRKFDKTPEPPGIVRENQDKKPVFVIHKHDATRLHYDLRLEFEGVLKSWAVTKRPSTDPGVKRLAVAVEDHPYDYKEFEGVIPEGNYGAGPVMIWDEGTFEPVGEKKNSEENFRFGYNKGHLQFKLFGSKLQGLFDLVQIKNDPKKLAVHKKRG